MMFMRPMKLDDGILYIDKTTATRLTANALKNVATPGGVTWRF